MKTANQIAKVGQKIVCGSGEDREAGVIGAIDGRNVTVQWESGHVTTQPAESLGMTIGKKIELRPQGGIVWAAYHAGEFTRTWEYGSIDEDGQYEQDDDEVCEAYAEEFGLDEDGIEVIG